MFTFEAAREKQNLAGRHVLYMLNKADADYLASQRKLVREAIVAQPPEQVTDPLAFQKTQVQANTDLAYAIRSGNAAEEGTVYPGIIVSPWNGPHANIQVFLDGTDSYWATSRSEFHAEGPADPDVLYGQGRWHFHAKDGEIDLSDVNVLLIAAQETDRQVKLTTVLNNAGITWSWEPDARGTWIFAD